MRKSYIMSLLILLMSGQLFAQDAPLWMRYPAISPDGNTIAFSYKGDLYTVPAAGGKAYPLTLHEGYDFMPVWSSDSKQIAFASSRFGNFDIFVMPATGGKSTRLTYHSTDDYPSAFSTDNQQVIFSAGRLDAVKNQQYPTGRMPELYSISTQGGRVKQVLTTPAELAQYNKDGSKILYQDRKGYENIWRKHHTSSIARDIWIYDVAEEKHRKMTSFKGEDRNPVWGENEQSIFYLSEEKGSLNVFKTSVNNPSEKTQISSFEDQPVRFLSAAQDGTLAYSYDGEIYTQKEGESPKKVAIEIALDDRYNKSKTISISRAREMDVSPNGKEVVFVSRGEVFVASVKEGTTKRITNTPEQERSVSFSPDGKSILYASERNGSWNLYQSKLVNEAEKYFFNGTLIKEEAVLVSDKETFQPVFSPTGEEIAYWEERTTLKVLNLKTKATRTVLDGKYNFSYSDGDIGFSWSPDGKWLLAEYLQPEFWISEIGLIKADGTGEVINLTKSGFYDYAPKWMMDGQLLVWFSDRDGMQSKANTGATQADAYGLFFTQEAYDKFQLDKEEFALFEELEKEGKEEDKDEKDKKDKEKEDNTLKPVKIELAGIENRKVKLTLHSSRLSDAVVTPDGEKLLYLSRFEKGYDLWQTDLRSRETKILKKLGGSGGALQLDKKGKNLFVIAGGRISKIEIASGKKTGISLSGEMNLNATEERAYMFEHVWRQVKKKFYKPDLHGAKWDLHKERYSRFLPHINNNYDYSEFLSELLGELNASHTGSGYRGSRGGDATASLAAFYDPSFTGKGLKILEIMDKSPLISAKSSIKVGVIIEKINGQEILPTSNIAQILNNQAGKNTLIALFDPSQNKRWEETVKPISRGRQNTLLYERWVKQREQMTEKLSGGKLGYVHVASMNDRNYRSFYEKVLGKYATKEALIVDTRFNGGGDLVDDLTTFLQKKKYMDFVAPDGRKIGEESQRSWNKPSIVLAGESNYSDGHCFAYAYQALEIGKVVGMPVPGTCSFVWWETLQDPSLYFGIPNMGIFGLEKDVYLENLELQPDVLIENLPESVSNGEDKQLAKAVEELLKELE